MTDWTSAIGTNDPPPVEYCSHCGQEKPPTIAIGRPRPKAEEFEWGEPKSEPHWNRFLPRREQRYK